MDCHYNDRPSPHNSILPSFNPLTHNPKGHLKSLIQRLKSLELIEQRETVPLEAQNVKNHPQSLRFKTAAR